jgi:ankyrin repeat protein
VIDVPKTKESKSKIWKRNVALWDAVEAKDEKEVKRLISEGADANSGLSCTVLTHAASRSTVPIVRLLLEAGADINAPNYNYSRVVEWALGGQNMATLEYLLKMGAEITTGLILDAKRNQIRGNLEPARLVEKYSGIDIDDLMARETRKGTIAPCDPFIRSRISAVFVVEKSTDGKIKLPESFVKKLRGE